MAHYEYQAVQHPRTGKRYALEISVLTGDDETDVIDSVWTRAAGPLAQGDPTDPDTLLAFIENQRELAHDDAIWLRREFDRAS